MEYLEPNLKKQPKLKFKILQGRLARKLILFTVLISSVVALIMTGFQLYFYYLQDINKVQLDLVSIEKSYSHSLGNSIWVLDNEQIQSQLQGITSLPFIMSASIAIQGKKEWQVVSADKKYTDVLSSNTHIINLFKQYKNNNRPVGELILEVSFEDIYSSLVEKFFIVLASNILKTAIVSFFLLFAFHHLITRHLLKITQYTSRISPENIPQPLTLDRHNKRDDEIDTLVGVINNMLHNLESSYATIKEKSNRLEHELKENLIMTEKLTISEIDLKNKENQLKNIIDNLHEGLLILDEKLNVIRFNKASLDIFSYAENEFINIAFNTLFSDANLASSSLNKDDLIVFDSTHKKIKGIRNNGDYFPVSLSLVKINQDKKTYYIGTLLDITKQHEQEENIRRIQKMDALGNLTGGIAHDYNNMLGVIIGYSELLKESLEGNPKLEQFADQIFRAGERGSLLTKKLLSFSRKKQPDAHLVNINSVLTHQEDMLKKALTALIDIKLELVDDLWSVWLDSNDLIDVVLNLSINAMHAMEKGGQLTITTRNETVRLEDVNYLDLDSGDYVILSITDTGIGMDEATRNKMFDPFFSTKGEQGTGLGLSQVYGFVKSSGGTIKVYSEIGHGTRITLYFPRKKSSKESTQSPQTLAKNVHYGNETILIVDDEPALVALAKDILSSHGYQVLLSNNAEQALNTLNEYAVDLLFSDIIMPEMDGYQLANQVKKSHPNVHILLCSGFEDNRHADLVDDSLFKQMLHKPYTSELLLEHVRKTLDMQKI